MLDFQQKRKLRSLLYKRFTLGVLGLFVILAIHSSWNIYQKQKESAALLSLAQKQSEELLVREANLQQKIADMKTPQGLEAEIRAKFNVAKPDENVAVVLQSENDAEIATTTLSFWQKFWKFWKF